MGDKGLSRGKKVVDQLTRCRVNSRAMMVCGGLMVGDSRICRIQLCAHGGFEFLPNPNPNHLTLLHATAGGSELEEYLMTSPFDTYPLFLGQVTSRWGAKALCYLPPY